jgi:cyclase
VKRLAASIFIFRNEAWVTKKFQKSTYLGEPSNLVRILNELECDEVIVSAQETSHQTLKLLSNQAFMPLTYGGGIRLVEDAARIIEMGYEKISISSLALDNPCELNLFSSILGQASVILTVTVAKSEGQYKLWDWRSRKSLNPTIEEYLSQIDFSSIGELFVRSFENNGTRKGIDKHLVERVRSKFEGNLIYEGGVGKESHVTEGWDASVDCVASSSYLSLYGKFQAPLLYYPNLTGKPD